MAQAQKTALISVSDKTGLVELGQALANHGFKILSTGGSGEQLKAAGVPIIAIADHTQFPEMMGGRVKTLHPKIHGGLLGRRGIDDALMNEHGIEAIDLVVVNLYPFAQTIAKPDCTLEEAIENIDIGGPAMIRSAAKNHASVTVVCDPSDYPALIEQLPLLPDDDKRYELAVKAFAHTAAYDGQISQWLSQAKDPNVPLAPIINLSLEASQTLRYGENPHQAATLYRTREASASGLAHSPLIQGKPLSFNNLLDADAAVSVLRHVQSQAPDLATCAIIKHTNPCGVAQAETALLAWERALACDPTSAFGGIVALSHPLDAPLAEILSERFLEVIVVPAISDEARRVLAQKKNLRVVLLAEPKPPRLDFRAIDGGWLVQQADGAVTRAAAMSVVTECEPTESQWQDLLFAWAVVRSVRSNAIVYAKAGQTLGLGVGQMSRIDSARFGALKAKDSGLSLIDSAMASDAFFPFADSIETAQSAGISSIIQPGGSMRDQEVIDACNRAGIAMVFTHTRHFKH